MACAIHGPDSLCNTECPGYLTASNPDAVPDNGNGPADSDMKACYELMHKVMTAHEDTRGEVSRWVDSVEKRMNALAAEVNAALERMGANVMPESPQSDNANANADNDRK